MISKFQVIKKVVLKPNKENPRPFLIERDTDYPEYWYGGTYNRVYTPVSDTTKITDIDMRDWTITYKLGPTEKFEKVAAIIGEEKAAEVMEVLGL